MNLPGAGTGVVGEMSPDGEGSGVGGSVGDGVGVGSPGVGDGLPALRPSVWTCNKIVPCRNPVT